MARPITPARRRAIATATTGAVLEWFDRQSLGCLAACRRLRLTAAAARELAVAQ